MPPTAPTLLPPTAPAPSPPRAPIAACSCRSHPRRQPPPTAPAANSTPHTAERDRLPDRGVREGHARRDADGPISARPGDQHLGAEGRRTRVPAQLVRSHVHAARCSLPFFAHPWLRFKPCAQSARSKVRAQKCALKRAVVGAAGRLRTSASCGRSCRLTRPACERRSTSGSTTPASGWTRRSAHRASHEIFPQHGL